MKISTIQECLETLQAQHGDIECYLEDPDTGWIMDFKSIEFSEEPQIFADACLYLKFTSDYSLEVFG